MFICLPIGNIFIFLVVCCCFGSVTHIASIEKEFFFVCFTALCIVIFVGFALLNLGKLLLVTAGMSACFFVK